MRSRLASFVSWGFLLILGLIVIHTPITMLLAMLVPELAIPVKGWKELLLVITAVGCLLFVLRDVKLRAMLKRDGVVWVAGIFVVTHITLSFYQFHGWHAYLAGLANDLRYVVAFLVAMVLASKVPEMRNLAVKVVLIGAVIVGVFGVMQSTILPHDILKYIGYDWGPGKVAPYMTVDSDSSYIRVSSTLRGPNPLGFYSATILIVTYAWLVAKYRQHTNQQTIAAIVVISLMAVCLWFSYSRGALVAAVAGLAIVTAALFWFKYKKWIVLTSAIAGFAGLLALTVFRHDAFVATVLFHDSPTAGTEQVNSNDGHLESLRQGYGLMLRQPIGAGIGSSGSASYYSNDTDTLYIENQYLYIAHESGWLGLGSFLVLFGLILSRLWRLRSDYLALGLFASGVGLSITSLVLPVWSDDTIAYIWWGMAGLVAGEGLRVANYDGSVFRRLVRYNRLASAAFDRAFIPSHWRIDGLADYRESVLPPLVENANMIHDVGGGKLPYIGSVVGKRRNQTLIGFDIDESELKKAPAGTYDSWVVGDIGSAHLQKPKSKADLVICQVVLEHVKDNSRSIRNIIDNTKIGGTVTLFVPSRNAIFARLNMLLPQKFKERVLFSIFPESQHAQGFPAYYHLCTVKEMRRLVEDQHCTIIDQRHYYQGYYFSFFLPLHVVWRTCQAVSYIFIRENSADFYSIVAVKKRR